MPRMTVDKFRQYVVTEGWFVKLMIQDATLKGVWLTNRLMPARLMDAVLAADKNRIFIDTRLFNKFKEAVPLREYVTAEVPLLEQLTVHGYDPTRRVVYCVAKTSRRKPPKHTPCC